MNYQVVSKTNKGCKKESHERNGDFCGWIEEPGCVVLALADGVGSCADDARASKNTCDLFLEKCRKALGDAQVLTEEKLAQFCREIDPVLAVDNDMACFCAVVWYENDCSVMWLHVGDTRIYRYNKTEGLVQMTKDDHGKAVNIKVGGKLYTDHGAVVSATPINNAIGDHNCNFHTGSFEFNPGESIVLCSDGMYNSSSFRVDVDALLNEADMANGVRKISSTDDDDASLLVLRCGYDLGETGIRELMASFEEYQAFVPSNVMIDRFSNELEVLLDAGLDVDEIVELVAFMKAKQLYPDRNRIDRIFTIALKRLNALPEGEDKHQFNEACVNLKEMLRHAFIH